MNSLHFFTEGHLAQHLKKRDGETKLGEKLRLLSSWNTLQHSSCKYVLLGIPEDVGVRANHGKSGTASAWNAAIHSLINIQNNDFIDASKIGILGTVNCDDEMKQAAKLELPSEELWKELGALVDQIDLKVIEVIRCIVAEGKVPIIIGGGHNNSYGILTGVAKALDTKINCINFDAHTDFRRLEHRHSGNGFSYAYEKGSLDRYFIFGLHRNYTSKNTFEQFENQKERIRYNLFEDIKIKQSLSFTKALKQAEEHCCTSDFGLELDLDAIAGMGSSAMTPSGFTLEEARQWVHHFSHHENFKYIHLCEGAPEREAFPGQVGKSIAYLISDIIAS